MQIAQAACRLAAYDFGFKGDLAWTQLSSWQRALGQSIESGEDAESALSPSHAGTKAYTNNIEHHHPGYIRELYRYAIKTKGSRASFEELANTISEKSAAPGASQPELAMSEFQLWRWFKQNGGKERSSLEKPLLNDELKRKRLDWAKEHYDLLTLQEPPVGFLDEKWFYVHNRRKRLKILPCGPGEQEGADEVAAPKCLSCRFPVKAMFMGVVARPRPEHNFDGTIMLKRVSKTQTVTRATSHHRFSDDIMVNYQIKTGDWRSLYVEGMKVGDLSEVVVEAYNLDGYVADRLEFTYKTFVGTIRVGHGLFPLKSLCVPSCLFRKLPNAFVSEWNRCVEVDALLHFIFSLNRYKPKQFPGRIYCPARKGKGCWLTLPQNGHGVFGVINVKGNHSGINVTVKALAASL